MATNLLLLADTHIPARAKRLSDAVLQAIDAADIVVHAGDWIDLDTHELLQSRARVLHGVYGNNDGPTLRERLPEVAYFTVEDLHLAVIHETGQAKGREKRADLAFPSVDVLIFGHSHIPWDTVSPGGMRLLNPGSPTDRRRQPHCTMMTASISGNTIEVELHRVERA
ncbi:metallophosphoesterase family protein [Enteractinococcus coprophilus]|uniref:Phosphoesterase n=1 Tax=Enteractinococcus coprophilus TaxID=1027633 RepID=A0A543APH7_9MICC|nr:YfcE family phosphodiesterase [Enteractinococcus coprophilus]TQL74468.1 hypothetical protein FB556_0933 [Enteractinococcus coprophilus]